MSKKKPSLLSWVREYLYIPVAMLLAFIVGGVIFVFGIIPSGSMEPTYMTNSIFIGNRLANEETLARGTPVLFHYDEKQIYIKRVIGLPGDTVSFADGHVLINGAVLDESAYLSSEVATHPAFADDIFTVPDDAYFVMGDNRVNSFDSRFWEEDGRSPFVRFDDVVGTMIAAAKLPFLS